MTTARTRRAEPAVETQETPDELEAKYRQLTRFVNRLRRQQRAAQNGKGVRV